MVTALQNSTGLRAYEKIEVATALCRFPRKGVYICSPLKGGIKYNILRARAYCRFAFTVGCVPICPHIYFTQFLRDWDVFERAAGMRYGLEAMHEAQELWVFGCRISEGMKAEIELAEDLGIPIRYFTADLEERGFDQQRGGKNG